MSIHIKVTLPYLFLLQNKKKEHTKDLILHEA